MKPVIKLESVEYKIGIGEQAKCIIKSISFEIFSNKIYSLVGESGSGKTTLAKLLCGLIKPTTGEIQFDKSLSASSIQLLFQNSEDLLNPYRNVADVLNDANPIQKQLNDTCTLLKIDSDLLSKKCSELSVGERQRIALARIIFASPKVLILDEPFSAQDPKSKESIAIILEELKNQGLTIILITHDIDSVKSIADKVFVMYSGVLVEQSDSQNLFKSPLHPYTNVLIKATSFDKDFRIQSNNLEEKISGCVYYNRCDVIQKECLKKIQLHQVNNAVVLCNFYSNKKT